MLALCFTGSILMDIDRYKKEEQSKRFAVYLSAAVLSGAFGGLLAGAITGGLHGAHGISGWRWLFIVEGTATIVSGTCIFCFYKS
jgi:MFS family permease